jgi:hypothetical protein
MLDGRSVRIPFMGAASFEVAKSDWRRDAELPDQPPRAFFTRYKEAGSSGTVLQVGPVQIIWEATGRKRDAAVNAMGWLFAGRFAIIKVSLLFTLGT